MVGAKLSRNAGALTALLLAVSPGLALAQAAKPAAPAAPAKPDAQAAPPVDTEPQTTSATFGDWTLRCQKLPPGGDTARVCEVAQTIQGQGQAGPVAEIALGRLKKTDPVRVTLVLPVNVIFPSSPTIAETKDAAPLELAWRKCLPGGCFSDAAVKDEVLKRMSGAAA